MFEKINKWQGRFKQRRKRLFYKKKIVSGFYKSFVAQQGVNRLYWAPSCQLSNSSQLVEAAQQLQKNLGVWNAFCIKKRIWFHLIFSRIVSYSDLPPPSIYGGSGWEVPKLSWNLISYRDWCQTKGFMTFRYLEPP